MSDAEQNYYASLIASTDSESAAKAGFVDSAVAAYSKVSNATVKGLIITAVKALAAPVLLLGDIVDIGTQIIAPLLNVFSKNKQKLTAGDIKTISNTIVTFAGSSKGSAKSFNFKGTPAQTEAMVRKELGLRGITSEDIAKASGEGGSTSGHSNRNLGGVHTSALEDPNTGSFGIAVPDYEVSSAKAVVGYSVGSGMGARGDAWRSEDGGNYEDTTYGTNPDNVPQSPDAARKWANKRREAQGFDTDVDGNPLPLGDRHYAEAQRAMNNLGRQPNAEETHKLVIRRTIQKLLKLVLKSKV